MIAHARPSSKLPMTDSAGDQFIGMLPTIRRQASVAFRHTPLSMREDLVEEVAANAYVAFSRLVALGKRGIAYGTPLAQFAIRQVRAGRRVGNRLNTGDVLSPANRRVTVEPLERAMIIEDRHAGPAATAAARIDLAAWLESLACRERRIACRLAQGETAIGVARAFGLSVGRVSQLRCKLGESWAEFQGEPVL